ncbi:MULTISPECIES: cell division topological specificity factor MinE [Limnobacter]|uniref:Cell division topological specificity factor n=1 Tax=Limnobacter litoralis TaxID=481366 RepID=A0ABQ5YR90_9BURK|nr:MULTISPECIES: cell division topological specificity factor MinE [Limnobacter]GLR27140.1 cell division topological specificity factor [Limnobacter litoralis]HEX5484413.1 cell division topological specificity factor MinE [Limnobacter sp.]
MSLLTMLFGEKKKSASVAKERLSLIIARERVGEDGPDFLPQLRDELMQVISKYVKIDQEDVKFNLQKQGNMEMLEVNIVLPDQH